jgi:hypothetical protein
VSFFDSPSAQSWYLAHNASVVAGYLAHRVLASNETRSERFFMNVVLVRVLYAHTVVLDAKLALGRLSFLGRLVGHPRMKTPQVLLAMKRVLPESYPISPTAIEEIIAAESRVGSMLDYGVIGPRIEALYRSSARALDQPLLLSYVEASIAVVGRLGPRLSDTALRGRVGRSAVTALSQVTRRLCVRRFRYGAKRR